MNTRYKLLLYTTANGRQPYADWLRRLEDKTGAHLIGSHLNRIRLGHLSKTRFVGDGVWELKINFGPGYRVYYLLGHQDVIVLLGGGDKASQDGDIRLAKMFAFDYWRRR
jgi:putative addiction module killer protein